MELIFSKNEEGFVAEFSVTNAFNLHIEREEVGFIQIKQRTTTEGKYDYIKGLNITQNNEVIDYDFSGVIYPKFIKIVSKVEPTMAEVTCPDGEVTIVEQKPKTITFKIEDEEYSAEAGMTWLEWCNSEYDTGGYYDTYASFSGENIPDYAFISKESNSRIYKGVVKDNVAVKVEDIIENGTQYSYIQFE